MSVTNAVAAEGTTDDVVCEHRFDVQIVFLRFFRKVSGTQQALLFARHGHENDRRVEFVFRHHARHFQNCGSARSIIVGAGRVALGVGWAVAHRVVVSADNIDSVH